MRFKVGDLARVVVAFIPSNQGRVIEIEGVGPFRKGSLGLGGFYQSGNWDYVHTGGSAGCYDWQLQPINAPEEPKSLTMDKEKAV